MPSLENVDVVRTKDVGDISLAQLLMDAVIASDKGFITVQIDSEGTGFIITIPHSTEHVH